MKKFPLWESINKKLDGQQEHSVEVLRSIPVFTDIPDRGLKIIRSLCHLRHYKEGEHVFSNGEPGVGMYVILEGSVDIYRSVGDFHQEYAILYAGDFFGEIALLDDLPRTASARARNYSALLGFFRPDLLNLLNRNPSLAGAILMNIARLIGRRLVNTNLELEKAYLKLQEKEQKSSILDRATQKRKQPQGE